MEAPTQPMHATEMRERASERACKRARQRAASVRPRSLARNVRSFAARSHYVPLSASDATKLKIDVVVLPSADRNCRTACPLTGSPSVNHEMAAGGLDPLETHVRSTRCAASNGFAKGTIAMSNGRTVWYNVAVAGNRSSMYHTMCHRV